MGLIPDPIFYYTYTVSSIELLIKSDLYVISTVLGK